MDPFFITTKGFLGVSVLMVLLGDSIINYSGTIIKSLTLSLPTSSMITETIVYIDICVISSPNGRLT